MPRIDPAEFTALPLRAFEVVEGLPLHDVWRVDLEGVEPCTIPQLRALLTPERMRSVHPAVKLLFGLRAALGRLFRLDPRSKSVDDTGGVSVPSDLARDSLIPTGTAERSFRTLFVLAEEAAYETRNATVHAVLVVALVRGSAAQRFYWASYVEPVGRITSFYMRLIDPFRRLVVYPGLEAWLKRAWQERNT